MMSTTAATSIVGAATTTAPASVTTLAPLPQQVLAAEVDDLGVLCSWARSSALCYGTIIPLTVWVVVLTALLIYCFRASNIKSELGRLPDWTCSPLVPVSFRELSKKKQIRIFNKLRKIPVASLFARLRLGEEFLEGCAGEGVASLGDLLTLTPMFLWGLGFGAHERQLVARCIESRAHHMEEARQAARDKQVFVKSSLATILVDASERNSGDTEFYVTRPRADALRRHMDPAVALRMSPSVLHDQVSTTARTADIFQATLGLVSEEVSRLFWELLGVEIRENPERAREEPMIQLMCGRREAVKVSRELYLAFRRKWFVAQQTPIVVGIQVQSAYRYLVERFQPQFFHANQQFWLGFVLRWNQHEEAKTAEKDLSEAKILATGDAVLHRVPSSHVDAGLASNSSFTAPSDITADLQDGDMDEELDEQWVDAFVDEFSGAASATDHMRHETFSVRVQLVKMKGALSLLDNEETFAAGGDLPCNQERSNSMSNEDEDDDDDAKLFRDVYFDTTVRFWNDYVHEFQCGELCVFEDEEEHLGQTGMLSLRRSMMRDKTRVLMRVVNDNIRRRGTQRASTSPAESQEHNDALNAVRQRAVQLRRMRGISVVWKQMREGDAQSTTADQREDQTP
jgi:hypothetical protein